MADTKQGHLNGAFYGPSIPPQQSYHRHGRGRGCLCGPCCILGLLCKLIVSVVIILGIAALVIWLVLRPSQVKFHVVDASLTEFNFTNNQLRYNLAVNMTIRNPNKKIGIYYDRIEANVYYKGERFSTKTLTPFYQGHKNTSTLNPSFAGQQLVVLGGSDSLEYNKERSNGVFEIDMKLYLRIRFKVGKFKTNRYKPKIKCDFKVPLASNGASTTEFRSTKCKLDY